MSDSSFAALNAATQALYGTTPGRASFANNCLLARRLVERGVRFVQLFSGGAFGSPRINWDGHENLKENHQTQAATMDRPVAALIQDLKQRGMFEDTLLLWNTAWISRPSAISTSPRVLATAARVESVSAARPR